AVYLLHLLIEFRATDTAAQHALQTRFDDGGETPELTADDFGLMDEHLQHTVLRPLPVEKVVATDLRLGLELAIDAAVPLLESARVPRHVEVEEVCAVRLEVQPLSRRVGREQNAQRVRIRVGVERSLELPTHGLWCGALEDGDALTRAVCVGQKH